MNLDNEKERFNQKLGEDFKAALKAAGATLTDGWPRGKVNGWSVAISGQRSMYYPQRGIDIKVDGVYGTSVRQQTYKIGPSKKQRGEAAPDLTEVIKKGVVKVLARIQVAKDADAALATKHKARDAELKEIDARQKALEQRFRKAGFPVDGRSLHQDRVALFFNEETSLKILAALEKTHD